RETQSIVGLWTSFLLPRMEERLYRGTKNRRILHFLIWAKGFAKPSVRNWQRGLRKGLMDIKKNHREKLLR
ncbi:MAG: hypothetical protein QQN41_08070, partial [Nitrosopumilus sp.]